jgi:hypothetical protein
MGVREAIPRKQEAQEGVSSFAKSLFLGEIHEELVFPWPKPDREEQDRIRDLNARIRDYCAEHYDARKAEEERWIPDQVLRDLGEIGALGLYVDKAYGGQGLSDTPVSSRPSARSMPPWRSSSAFTSRSASRASRCSAPMSRRSASSPTWPRAGSSPPSR